MAIRKPFFVEPCGLSISGTGNAQSGNPAANLQRLAYIGMTWKTSGASNAWVRGQIYAPNGVDFVSLVSANALAGTTIRVRLGTSQAQVDGTAPYDSGAQTFISPATTTWNGRYHSHLEIPSPVGCTWFRIDIGGHTGDFEGANLVMGRKFEPGRFYNVDYERGAKDLGSIDFGRWGVPDITPGTMMRTLDFTLARQSVEDYETTVLPMIMRLATRNPIFLCFDPESTIHRQNRTYMGPLLKPPVARGVRKPTHYSQDFQILSFI